MGLSQRAMARKAGTTASVICRLEDADYEGHSLAGESSIRSLARFDHVNSSLFDVISSRLLRAVGRWSLSPAKTTPLPTRRPQPAKVNVGKSEWRSSQTL